MEITGKRFYEPQLGYCYAIFHLDDGQEVKIWKLGIGRYGVESSEFSANWILNVVDFESAVGCLWYLKHILCKLGISTVGELCKLWKSDLEYKPLRDFLYGDNRFDKQAGTTVFGHIREGLPKELRYLLPSVDETRQFRVCWR